MRHLRSSVLRLSVLTLLIASTFGMSAPASAGTVTVTGPFCSGQGGVSLAPWYQAYTTGTCATKYVKCTYLLGGGSWYTCTGGGWSYNTYVYASMSTSALAATGDHQMCNSDFSICGTLVHSYH